MIYYSQNFWTLDVEQQLLQDRLHLRWHICLLLQFHLRCIGSIHLTHCAHSPKLQASVSGEPQPQQLYNLARVRKVVARMLDDLRKQLPLGHNEGFIDGNLVDVGEQFVEILGE